MYIKLSRDYSFRKREREENHKSLYKGSYNYDIAAAIVDAFHSYENVVVNKKDNTNSIQNLNTYSEKLDKLHWAWPYDMSTKEMSDILLEYDTEKEFDIAISNWFTQEKIEEMFYETCYMIKYPHKTIFNQAYRAFLNQDYAIANNALLSVVDNLLAIYNKEKRSTKRYGILKPVVQYYETMPKIETYSYYFDLLMLSNNIDFVFEIIWFDNIRIDTNKTIRRNTSVHGFKYSNKRVDTIMLFNLIYVLLMYEHRLRLFKRKLVYKNGCFRIDDSILHTKITNMIESFVFSIISMDKMTTHKELVAYIEKSYFAELYPGKMGIVVSKTLQKLKKENRIKSIMFDSKLYWCINEE